jgi:hypothetical protein
MTDDDRMYHAVCATGLSGVDLIKLAKEAVDHGTDWHHNYRRTKAAKVMDLLDLIIWDMEDRP